MKKLILPLCLSLAAAPCLAAAPSGLYFGQELPGDTPVVFAPGIVSQEDRFEQFLLISPDGKLLVYCLTNNDWSSFTLESRRFEGGAWSEPAKAPFQGESGDALVAAFSYDMRRVFFTSTRPFYPPSNIWMSERRGDAWSEPTMVPPPISSDGVEWEVAIARNGTLYFSSARNGGYGDLDLYRARPRDGAYSEVENMGPTINTAKGDDLPYIAPDESYLVFASNREGGYGKRDLYVSFQREDRWTPPVNLGPQINTEGFNNYPFVSPDGKVLFFGRRTEWMAKEDSDIYWVSTAVIDRLRPQGD